MKLSHDSTFVLDVPGPSGAREAADHFVGAHIVREQQDRPTAFGQARPKAFDASQYGFFGTMDDAHDSLGGALEDGLEAPPEEEGLELGAIEEPHNGDADAHDLGMASLFRQRTASKEEQEETAFLDHLPLGDPDDEELLSADLPWAGSSTPQDMSFLRTLSAAPPLLHYGASPASGLAAYTQLASSAAAAQLPSSLPHDHMLSHPCGALPAATPPKMTLTLEELEARMMGTTFTSHPPASSPHHHAMPLAAMYQPPHQQQPAANSPYMGAGLAAAVLGQQQQQQQQLLQDPAILASSHTSNGMPRHAGMHFAPPSNPFAAQQPMQLQYAPAPPQAPAARPPPVMRAIVPPLPLHLARQHQGMHSPHSTILSPHTSMMSPHSGILSPHTAMLSPHTAMLSPHTAMLSPHAAMLSPHAAMLSPHAAMPPLGGHLHHAPPPPPGPLPMTPAAPQPPPTVQMQAPHAVPLQRPPRPPTRTPPGFGPQDPGAGKPLIPRLVFKAPPASPSPSQPPPPPHPSPRTLAAASDAAPLGRDGGRVATPRMDDHQRLHHPSPRQQQQHHHAQQQQQQQRRHPGSKLMSADEIDSILRIQYMATHGGTPYQEDHYYQAYLHKLRGNRPSRTLFAPATLRDITNPDANAHTAAVRVLGLDGLGTIVLSNIRTPKMLMDLSSGAPPPSSPAPSPSHPRRSSSGSKLTGGSDAAPSVRPLEREPLLAARMMIEDCMSLLLDIDDIDRTFAAAHPHGRADAVDLRTRRWMLVKGILASFRLPTHPVPAPEERADGIFLRVMALPKGRSFLARTLRLLFPPTPSLDGSLAPHAAMVLTVLWALLRNAAAIFTLPSGPGTTHAAADLRGPSSRISNSAAEVVRKLDSAEAVAQSLQALTQGTLATAADGSATLEQGLLPLLPPPVPAADGDGGSSGGQAAWLADVVGSLMLRASELGLDVGAGGVGEDEQGLRAGDARAAVAALWRAHFQHFLTAMLRHLDVLGTLWQQAQVQQDVAGAAVLRSISPVQLVRTMLPHCSEQQQSALRAALSRVTTY